MAETFAPKVIQMDADGRPLTQHETTVTKKQVTVDTIPWIAWAEKHTQRNDRDMAKLMLMLAMGMLHDNATTEIPIACVRKGPVIQALATRIIEAGEFVVPLFVKKQSSMVSAGDGVTIRRQCAQWYLGRRLSVSANRTERLAWKAPPLSEANRCMCSLS